MLLLGAAAEQQAAEALEERLASVLALPEERRSPEASAFLTGAQLMQQARRLLAPDGARGGAGMAAPEPAPTELGRGRLLLAILLVARADYISPQTLLTTAWDVGRRLAAVMRALPAGSVERLLAAASGADDTAPPASPPQQQQQQQHPQPLPPSAGAAPQQRRSTRQAQAQQAKQEEEARQQAAAEAARRGAQRQAAGVLLLFSYAACADLQRDGLQSVRAALRAATLLDTPACRDAVTAQLAALDSAGLKLRRRPLLTADQLQLVCWCRVAERGARLLAKLSRPSARLITGTSLCSHANNAPPEVEAAVAASVRALLVLEPTHLRALLAAGEALRALGHPRHAAKLHLRAFQIASASRSDYWRVRSAAALLCGSPPGRPAPDVPAAQLAAAMATLQEADEAVERCERLLPEEWMPRLRADASAGRRHLVAAQAQLDMLRHLAEPSDSGGSGSGGSGGSGGGGSGTRGPRAAAHAAPQLPLMHPEEPPQQQEQRGSAWAAHGGAAPGVVAPRKLAAARLASQAFAPEYAEEEGAAGVAPAGDGQQGCLQAVPTERAGLQQQLELKEQQLLHGLQQLQQLQQRQLQLAHHHHHELRAGSNHGAGWAGAGELAVEPVSSEDHPAGALPVPMSLP